MTKNELIAAVAERANIPRSAAASAVEATFAVIAGTLRKGGEVKIPGFGSFKVVKRAAREGLDLHTGQLIKIAEARSPKFSPGQALRDAVNQ
ncbi:MAG: HU family DNA-binding protein [Variibacter sp.]|nr:HU family DNA-binding protein [Variibacter sp.]